MARLTVSHALRIGRGAGGRKARPYGDGATSR
jgi:hypothetical protein